MVLPQYLLHTSTLTVFVCLSVTFQTERKYRKYNMMNPDIGICIQYRYKLLFALTIERHTIYLQIFVLIIYLS